jgi:hypothetical protein
MAGEATRTIQKFLKTNLAAGKVDESTSYGGTVYAYGATILTSTWQHIYNNNPEVFENKSCCWCGDESTSYGGTVYALWGERYSHLHGRHNYKNNPEVFENKSCAGKVDESTSYGSTVYALWGDDTHTTHGRRNKHNPEVIENKSCAGKVEKVRLMVMLSLPYGETILTSTWQAQLQEQSRSF